MMRLRQLLPIHNGWGFRPIRFANEKHSCMKKHHIKQAEPDISENHTKAARNPDGRENLDRTAEELDALARKRLPDRVLGGVLTGYESDIRQDAILLALEWYLRQAIDPGTHSKYPWHAARAIAAALNIHKRDYIKAIKKEADALRSMPGDGVSVQEHPARTSPCDWPLPTKRRVMRKAMRIALKDRRISPANVVVAMGVLIKQIPVKEMAERLGVNRSAVYQHLNRVRREVPHIIDQIEVPIHELL